MDIDRSELHSVMVLERFCSSLSLVAVIFIIVTYLLVPAFDKPINRLIFFASIGNVFANIATLIAQGALNDPGGSLCQTQAFLIQMLMPADAYWTLAMACNVWLTFQRKVDAKQLRHLEKYYLMLCYGLPLIPAFTFIFVSTAEKGHMYSDATIWCWISPKWDTWRILSFYMPVWITQFFVILIYTQTGKQIWQRRKELRAFRVPPQPPRPVSVANSEPPDYCEKTVEIVITSEPASPVLAPQVPGPPGRDPRKKASYSVIVTAKPRRGDRPSVIQNDTSFMEPTKLDGAVRSPIHRGHVRPCAYDPTSQKQHATNEANTAAWAYAKVCFLFFCAMMITWIPSSANRVYSVAKHGEISVALSYASAFVLPLQGFWNAVIYIATSLPACKVMFRRLKCNRAEDDIDLTSIHCPECVLHHHHDNQFGDRDSRASASDYSLHTRDTMQV